MEHAAHAKMYTYTEILEPIWQEARLVIDQHLARINDRTFKKRIEEDMCRVEKYLPGGFPIEGRLTAASNMAKGSVLVSEEIASLYLDKGSEHYRSTVQHLIQYCIGYAAQ